MFKKGGLLTRLFYMQLIKNVLESLYMVIGLAN